MESEQKQEPTGNQPKLYQPTISNDVAKRAMHHSKVLSRLLARLDEPMANFDGLSNEQIDAKVAELLAGGIFRSDAEKALAIGETVSLGGEDVRVDPLPARKAEIWRGEYVSLMEPHWQPTEIEGQADIYKRLAGIPKSRLLALELYLEKCGATVPENATDNEVKKALDIAELLSFPIDALIQTGQGTSAEPKRS